MTPSPQICAPRLPAAERALAERALAQVVEALAGAASGQAVPRVLLASFGPDPRAPLGPDRSLRVWCVTPAAVLLGLRAWSDVQEGLLEEEGARVSWSAVEVERGLRELLRQSLGGLETLMGAPLPWREGWVPSPWARHGFALAPGALHAGAVDTLRAAAQGLGEAGHGEGALRLARAAWLLAREGRLCGHLEALEASGAGLGLAQMLEASVEARGACLPARPLQYEALDAWLRRLRLASLRWR